MLNHSTLEMSRRYFSLAIKDGHRSMVTMYVGVFCVSPKCGKFNVLTQYEVERPEQIGTDFRFPLDEEPFACGYCGNECYHRDDVIAHSTSPDGGSPQYPHRTPLLAVGLIFAGT